MASRKSNIGALHASVGMDASAFAKGAAQAQGVLTNLHSRFRQVMPAIGTLTATAFAGMAGSMGILATASVKNAAEIQRFATLTGSTTTEFQRWSAATKTVGVDMDKLADISKDFLDKISDYNVTGGGGAVDFFEQIAPKVGITSEAFKDLSGPQAMQLYISSLQKANVSHKDYVFFMEAMASDSSLLTPLLKNNGAELNRLADNAQRLGAVMSEDVIAELISAKKSFTEIGQTVQGFGNRIIASMAPALQKIAAQLNNTLHNSDGVSTAVDRMASAFSGLGNLLSSESFIQSGVTALTAFADIASLAARALVALTDNIGLVSASAGAAAIGLAAMGGPITLIVGLAAAAGLGIYTMVRHFDDAATSGTAFGKMAETNAGKLMTMANASKSAREELAKLITLQTQQAAAAAEKVGEALDRQNAKIEQTQRAWNGRAAGPFESVPDIGAMQEDAAALREEFNLANREAERLMWQREEANRLANQPDKPLTMPTFTGNGGDSGGGGKDDKKTSAYADTVKRLKDELLRLTNAQGKSALEQRIWNEQFAAGALGNEGQSAYIANLVKQTDALERQQEASANLKTSLADMFGSILSGSQSAGDAIKGLAKTMLSNLANNAMSNLMGSLLGGLGGGGGFWGGLLTSAFSIPGNANGTNNFKGGLSWVNERGGELMNLPSGTQIIPHDISRRMADSAGGGVTKVVVDLSPDLIERERSYNHQQSTKIANQVTSTNNKQAIPNLIEGYEKDRRARN